MSARTFNADTDDEDDGHPKVSNSDEGKCSHQTDSDSQADEEVKQQVSTTGEEEMLRTRAMRMD